MKSSLEIAQEATLKPIEEIAGQLGLQNEEIDPYGRYMAKVRMEALDARKEQASQLARLAEISERRQTWLPIDAVVARIDQIHTGRASLRLEDHPRPEAVRACTCADHRHRPGAEHGRDRCPALVDHLAISRRRPRF